MESLALLLLVLVPIAVWRYARIHSPGHLWLATGAAFGLVVAPLSVGLYATYFLGPLGGPTGILGLVSMLFHAEPGWEAVVWLGLVPSHEMVTGPSDLYIALANGVFWAAVYGCIGFIIDRIRLVRSRRVA